MPRSALLAALGAIALWGALAALSLRLKAWPPFLLVGAAPARWWRWAERDIRALASSLTLAP